MLNGDRSQIIGASPSDLSPEFQPDGKTSIESSSERIDTALRTGANKFEWIHRRFDGSNFFVEVSIVTIRLDGKIALFASWRDISIRKQAQHELERVVTDLQDALAKVNQLEGILPICSFCKKIRDEEGHWHQMEAYVTHRSQAQFSHGVCPDCGRKHYPEFIKDPPLKA